MQRLSLLFFCVLVTSCKYFQSKNTQTENSVSEALMAIDWNDVDTYPLFDVCDENTPKAEQKNCFQENMIGYFSEAFSDAEFEVEADLNDTLYVDFLIDEHGFISVLEIAENERINQLIPDFNDEVSARLNDLTTVAPALKRGIPVSMKFRLPLVLNTD